MKKALTYLTIIFVTLLLTMSWLYRTPTHDQKPTSVNLSFIVKEALKLGVLEVHISQFYEANKDHLKIANIPIPLTTQKSLLIVQGSALVGVDTHLADIHFDRARSKGTIVLPPPQILSLDAEIRTLYEKDSFLNRISVEDRNSTFRKIKDHVRKEILTAELQEKARERIRRLLDQWCAVMEIQYDLSFKKT